MIKYFQHKSNFKLESGVILPELTVAYHTFGQLNEEKNNVIWVLHALTANSDVSDWWSGLVGVGKCYDPTQHYIICANVLGSHYGSTGPLSLNSVDNQPFYHSFPDVTIRDMVAAHELLRNYLGIEKINTLIGGSLGGQQALEWSISNPDLAENLILLATNAQHSPWGIAFNESQRMAIRQDPTFFDKTPEGGLEGMKVARAIALLSYRTYYTYQLSQSENDVDKIDDFKASSYQQYQGLKLANRFNAFSYYTLSKAMDSHNVGRNRGSVLNALSKIKSKTLVIGIESDVLFPIQEQLFLSHHIPEAQFYAIDSNFGHDGFLIEFERICKTIQSFQKNFYVEA